MTLTFSLFSSLLSLPTPFPSTKTYIQQNRVL
jgi:hypothetical protein